MGTFAEEEEARYAEAIAQRVARVEAVYRAVKEAIPDAADNPLVRAVLAASVLLSEDLDNMAYSFPHFPSD